jgi:serine phosphatase RsbU (regulator of sigma subunit)
VASPGHRRLDLSEALVPSHGERTLAALRLLLRRSHLAGPDALPSLATEAGRLMGAERTVLHVVDYDQVILVPLLADDEPPQPPVPVEGTAAGQAYRDVQPQLTRAANGLTLWVPLVDGTARLGVLELLFPPPVVPDNELVEAVSDVAAMLGELTISRASYGDRLERARRRVPLTLPAEMQWRLLPPLTFVSERVAIAGVLAPTAEVAGDSFDYALNGDIVHVALLDALGHGLEAAVMATVAVAAYRNARREQRDLPQSTMAVETAIGTHFGPEKFVTGIIGELDCVRGLWRWSTCGHPAGLLVRGGRVVRELDEVTAPPLGLGLLGDGPPVAEVQLEPGDRIVLYTDGVVEARDEHGEFFTPERLAALVDHEASGGRPIAETLRRLNLAILEHQHGLLQDDATTVMVEWLGDEAARSTPPTSEPPTAAAQA